MCMDHCVIAHCISHSYWQQISLAGLSGSSTITDSDLDVKLTKERAENAEFAPEETVEVTKQLFQDGLGYAGVDLLQQGIQGLISDVERLEPVFRSQSIGAH